MKNTILATVLSIGFTVATGFNASAATTTDFSGTWYPESYSTVPADEETVVNTIPDTPWVNISFEFEISPDQKTINVVISNGQGHCGFASCRILQAANKTLTPDGQSILVDKYMSMANLYQTRTFLLNGERLVMTTEYEDIQNARQYRSVVTLVRKSQRPNHL